MDVDTAKYWTIDAEERARKTAEWNRPVLAPILAFAGLLALGSIPAVSSIRRRSRLTARERGQRRNP